LSSFCANEKSQQNHPIGFFVILEVIDNMKAPVFCIIDEDTFSGMPPALITYFFVYHIKYKS